MAEQQRFHVTKAGKVAPCEARKRTCPLGEVNHYESAAEAAKGLVAKGFVEPPGETLKLLARHEDPKVRRAVALNPTTSPELLRELREYGPEEAQAANDAWRRDHPKGLPEKAQPYLDPGPLVEFPQATRELLQVTSSRNDHLFQELQESLLKDFKEGKLPRARDGSPRDFYLEKAAQAGNGGFRNEFIIAASLEAYQGVEVFFPEPRTAAGGTPKVDMAVTYRDHLWQLSIKKDNGTQIEVHCSREKVLELLPGPKVQKFFESDATAIVLANKPFQEHGDGRLRLSRGQPRRNGTSVRFETFGKSQVRPAVPEESALIALSGVTQAAPIKVTNSQGETRVVPSSEAHLLLKGSFDSRGPDNLATPLELFSNSFPISYAGLRAMDLRVSVRQSAIGDRESPFADYSVPHPYLE